METTEKTTGRIGTDVAVISLTNPLAEYEKPGWIDACMRSCKFVRVLMCVRE